MQRIHNELFNQWMRMNGRPFIAKVAAGILVVGILSLVTSPEAIDRGKAAASQLSKPFHQETHSKDPDCAGRISPSRLTVNLQP